MSLASRIDLSQCGPAQLWATLEPEVRLDAARSLYAHDWGTAPTRREADFAIMHGMRFRESAVRPLPGEKRARSGLPSRWPGRCSWRFTSKNGATCFAPFSTRSASRTRTA
jgi:hypothetical protein